MNKLIILTSVAILGFMAQPVSAAPIYYTSISSEGTAVVTGTTYASYSNDGPSAGHGATVNITPEIARFDFDGYHNGYTTALNATGYMIFNDLIFSDTNNPTNISDINVSANIYSSGSIDSIDMDLHPVSNGGSTSVGNNLLSNYSGVSGLYTTQSVSIPLNQAISFGMKTIFAPWGAYYTTAYGTASAQAGLYLPQLFNLPEGITVNSINANIVNNTISTVPVPAAAWLFGSGLIGLIGVARRKYQ